MMSIINLRSASMRSMRSMNNNVSRYLATSVKSTDSSSNDMANLLEKLQNISKSSNAATAADGVAPAASKIKRQFSGNKNKKKFNNNNSNNSNNNNRSSGNGNSSTSGGKRSLSQKRPQNTRNKNFKKGGRNGRFNNNQGEFDSNFNDEHTIDNFQNDLEFEKNYINKLTNQKIEDYPNFKKFINNISSNNNKNSSSNKINSSGSIFQRIDEVDHKAIKDSLISRYFDKKRDLIFGTKPEQLIKFNDGKELIDSEGKELTFERINEINSFFFNDKLYELTNSKSLINEYKIKDKQELGSLIINSTKSGINLNSRIIRLIENYLSINSGLNLNDLFKDLNKLNGLKIIPLTNKVYPYTNTTISSSLIRNLVSIKSLNNKSNLNELINNIIKGKRNEIKLNSKDDKLNLVKSVISNSLNSNSQLKINNLHLKINDIANGLQKINELPKAINPPKLLK
ncbi:unnamed protein product [[Candida] boidinii]|nr:unnamed protein product [[Candida] boidinii]